MALIDKASLLMVPSTYEDGTLYNVLPSGNKAPDETGNHNGYDQTRADFTFSRGSNLAATRVNASGLIEKGRANYILYSQEFDNAYWNKLGVSITANQTTAPDGTLTADLLDDGTSTGNKFIEENEVIGGGVASMSIHAKYVDTQYLILAAYDTSYKAAAFDILNGTLGNSDSALIPAIEDLGDGWYRCSIAYPGNTRNDPYISIGIREDNVATLPNQTGANRQVYIWGAQLENGLVATDYIETGATTATAGVLENTPRIDYSSGAGALLLEPQRTNLTVHSEYLGASDWAKTRCTIEDNSTTSPEGLINSAKMTSTDANESYIQDIFSFTGSTISWSFFAKKGDLDYCHGLVWDLSANGCRQWFNVNDGTVGGATTFGSGYSVYSATIEDYGSGWYRCTMIVNGSSGSNGCRVSLSSANTIITSAVNSYGYFYGLQAEDSTYSSSLIPTYGSAATRGADSCSVTGVSDVIGQTEGTIYWEGIAQPNDNPILVQLIPSAAGNYTNTIYLEYVHSTTNFKAKAYDTGTIQASISTGNVVAGQVYKLAFAYKANDFALYMNGTQIGTDTSGSIQSGLDKIGVGSLNGTTAAAFYGSEAKQVVLFNERLSNTELAALTA